MTQIALIAARLAVLIAVLVLAYTMLVSHTPVETTSVKCVRSPITHLRECWMVK